MASLADVIGYAQLAVLVLIIVLSMLYCVPIILLSRFHHRIHVFSVNVCLASSLCCAYWIYIYFMSRINVRALYSPPLCLITSYAETMFTLQVPLSLIAISINRLCCIKYHARAFFRSIAWMFLCIASQWLLGAALPLFLLIRNPSNCVVPFWTKYYVLAVMIVAPLLASAIINGMIFRHVRASTNRLHPQSISIATSNTSRSSVEKISRRDLHLLRHIVLMLLIFLIGWTPIYTIAVLLNYMTISTDILRIFSLFAQLSILCDIVDLFVYNEPLRNCFRTIFVPC